MKKMISILLVVSMICAIAPVFTVLGAQNTISVSAEQFTDTGTWALTPEGTAQILQGTIAGKPAETKPAVVNIEAEADGEYQLYVMCKDYATINPGIRFFNVEVNGADAGKFGDHKQEGWQWQQGSTAVKLKKGVNQIRLLDSSGAAARMMYLVFTNDSNFAKPSVSDAAQLHKANAAVVSDKTADVTAAPSSVPSSDLDAPGIYIAAEMFKDSLGTWTVQPDPNLLNSEFLQGKGDLRPDSSEAAECTVVIPEDGEYYIYATGKDFEKDRPGIRHFKIQINYEDTNGIYGAHMKEGWDWSQGGPVELKKGPAQITLVDSSGSYPRTDLIILSKDGNLNLPKTKADKEANYAKYKAEISKTPVPKPTPVRFEKDGKIKVALNNQKLEFSDVEPILQNDRTLVPLRAIFEALSVPVDWSDETQTVTATKSGTKIQLTIDNPNAYVGTIPVILDQPPVLYNDRTLVPLRFVSESLGAVVDWDEETETVYITYQGGAEGSYYLNHESFSDMGTWSIEVGNPSSMNTANLKGTAPTEAGATPPPNPDTQPAVAYVDVAKEGTYKVWVKARDYSSNQPGTRHFGITVNGNTFGDKKFGQHGMEGFKWELAGEMELPAGRATVELRDTSGFYARCDGIVITNQLSWAPQDTLNAILAKAVHVKTALDENLTFPFYARTSQEGELVEFIENDKVRVELYQVNTPEGTVIQRQTYLKDGDGWLQVDRREDGYGYLVMYAKETKDGGNSNQFPIFNQTFDKNGKEINVNTPEVFQAGNPSWLLPSSMEKQGDSIVVRGENEFAAIEAVWTIPEGASEPKVTVKTTTKQDGAYSIGMFNSPEVLTSQVDFALVPYKIHSLQIPEQSVLVNEQYAYTPMSAVTLKDTSGRVPGRTVTYSVVVDPDTIPIKWAQKDTSDFGLGITGLEKNVQPSVFAPLFGTQMANVKAGETLEFGYRPVAVLGDWFENYRHIAVDIYGLRDYRTNYYSSVTDATFNTRELMMDDKYGGWDPINMEHYNYEAKNVTSQGNPLQALQSYLLTEDKEILKNRTIPTIASSLTRGSLHFSSSSDVRDGNGYVGAANAPGAIGSPVSGFNTSTFGAAYEMTRGLTPALKQVAVGSGVRYANAYGSIPEFSEQLAMYKYTNDKQYLDKAIELADKYLEQEVWKVKDQVMDNMPFIYISYYPHISSLMDIYEATGEQRYLDAAVETGKWLVTCLWTAGIDGDKANTNITVNDLDEIKKYYHYQNVDPEHFWWHGAVQQRVGKPNEDIKGDANDNLITAQTEQLPAWIPSRVGLGLEQGATFNFSANIIMSSWAGDMMRLAKYSGEELFETAARNAIVGRFSNYPGYYQNTFSTYQMKADYPYVGPDYSGIYWHHIPMFLSMLEDFLISQAWNWSDGKVDFPSTRIQGYAYFANRQYGFEAGKMFDQDDMWLWMSEDVAKADSMQIDWIAARKDGVLGFALMNEDLQETTSTITLGEAVPGGSAFTGKATLHYMDGRTEETDVNNGQFTVTVPSRDLVGVILNIPGVVKPNYAKIQEAQRDATVDAKETAATFTGGKGLVLQIDPALYTAYVYLTDKPDAVKSATLHYTVEGQAEQTMVRNQYPFEFLVDVEDVNKSITFYVEKESVTGEKTKTDTRTLKSILNKTSSSTPVTPPPSGGSQGGQAGTSTLDFEPFKVNLTNCGIIDNLLRFVVKTDNFPFEVTENLLQGCRLKGTFTDETGTHELDVILTANEKRPDSTVLVFTMPSNLEKKVYMPTGSDLTISPK